MLEFGCGTGPSTSLRSDLFGAEQAIDVGVSSRVLAIARDATTARNAVEVHLTTHPYVATGGLRLLQWCRPSHQTSGSRMCFRPRGSAVSLACAGTAGGTQGRGLSSIPFDRATPALEPPGGPPTSSGRWFGVLGTNFPFACLLPRREVCAQSNGASDDFRLELGT